MAETERLIVELEARVDKFEKGIAKAAADLDKVAQSAGRAEKAATEGGRKTSSAFREAAAGASAFQKAAHAAEQSNAAIARSAGLARHEMINLSRQVQDIGVSLASGQSPFTVLVQQGTQVGDIFGSTQGTMRGFAQQLGSIFTPMRLLVGGIVGVTAALAAGVIHVVNYARSMDDLAKMTGFAREELQALEKAGAIKGIASDDVMAGVKAFAAQIEQAQRGTNDLAELFRLNGKEIGTASENMRTLQELVRGAGDDMALIKEILRAAGIEPTMEWIRLLRDANGDIGRIKTSLADVKVSDEMVESSRRFAEGWATVWETVKANASAALVAIANAIEAVFSKIQQVLTFLGNVYARFGGGVQGGDNIAWRFGGSSTGDVKALEAYADALRERMGLQRQSNAETVRSLDLAKEEARLASLRVSILGEAATAADKEAAARARIEAARRQGVEISKTEEAAIIANATASKVSTKAAQDTSSALERLRQSREASIGLLQLEIANMFKSAEAARAAEIAYKELNKYKRAGVTITPEIKAEIEANAKLAAAYEKQIDDLKIVKKSIEDMKSTGVDFAKTFVSGLLEGKSAMDALAESAVNVGKKLQDAGLEQALLSLASGDLAGVAVGGTRVLNWPTTTTKRQRTKMTAINVVVLPERAAIISDSVVYDREGVVRRFANKVSPVPQWPGIVAARGSWLAAFLFAAEFTNLWRSLDDFFERGEPTLKPVHEKLRPHLGDEPLEVYTIGWSASRRRVEGYFFKTCAGNIGLPDGDDPDDLIDPSPYRLLPISGVCISPVVSESELKKIRSDRYISLDRCELVALLEMQRRKKFSRGGEERHWVGGWATLTTVTRAGIDSRSLFEWPEDRIGEIIRLAPAISD